LGNIAFAISLSLSSIVLKRSGATMPITTKPMTVIRHMAPKPMWITSPVFIYPPRRQGLSLAREIESLKFAQLHRFYCDL